MCVLYLFMNVEILCYDILNFICTITLLQICTPVFQRILERKRERFLVQTKKEIAANMKYKVVLSRFVQHSIQEYNLKFDIDIQGNLSSLLTLHKYEEDIFLFCNMLHLINFHKTSLTYSIKENLLLFVSILVFEQYKPSNNSHCICSNNNKIKMLTSTISSIMKSFRNQQNHNVCFTFDGS